MTNKELMLAIQNAAQVCLDELKKTFPTLPTLQYSHDSLGSMQFPDFLHRINFAIYVELIRAGLIESEVKKVETNEN